MSDIAALNTKPNLEVPWITLWSEEDRLEIRPCRYVGGALALWQPHAPGQGTPLFRRKHNVGARKAQIHAL